MLLVEQLFSKLVEHTEEDNTYGNPLIGIDIVIEGKDADDDCEYFSGSRYERENVLFEVCYDVVDTDLS